MNMGLFKFIGETITEAIDITVSAFAIHCRICGERFMDEGEAKVHVARHYSGRDTGTRGAN
jgi:hypothetical protein